MTDFDTVSSGRGEVFHAGSAGDIASDDGQGWESVSNEADCVAYSGAVTVGGGHGGDINAAIYEGADMVYNAIPIQIAVLGACGGYGRAA